MLVGRETELQDFDIAIQRFELGTGDRSRLLYGLRGVGKTVLLRKFVGIAEARDWTCRSVEAAAYLDFKVELADFARAALARLSARERLTGLLRRGLSVLKSFQLRYQLPEGPEIVAGVEPSLGEADFGNLKQNLGDLLVAIGRAAEERKTGVLFTVDEFQFLPREEMEALIVALHRVGQDELPVMVVGAGLPSILGKVGDARSYAERLFVFRRINGLGRDEARAVLEKPAADRGVHWSAAALDRAVEDTRGHPRFLQTLGEHCWKVAPGPSRNHRGGMSRRRCHPQPPPWTTVSSRCAWTARPLPVAATCRAMASLGTGAASFRRGGGAPRAAAEPTVPPARRADPAGTLLLPPARGDRVHGPPVRSLRAAERWVRHRTPDPTMLRARPCARSVAQIYPWTAGFRELVRYRFDDSLSLWCFPLG